MNFFRDSVLITFCVGVVRLIIMSKKNGYDEKRVVPSKIEFKYRGLTKGNNTCKIVLIDIYSLLAITLFICVESKYKLIRREYPCRKQN